MSVRLLQQETIEIAQRRGRTAKVPAHRYCDFAIHRPAGADLLATDWVLTHLPTGRRVAHGFESIEPAADAMIEIAKLRNDWAVVTDEDLTIALGLKCREIARKFGGDVGTRSDDQPRVPKFNGYQNVAR